MYYTKRVIRTTDDKQQYQELLKKSELSYEELEYAFGVFDEEKLIAAISLDNNCIKQICIEEAYQGEGLAASLVSEIILYASNKGVVDLFVFTKPQYEIIFNNLGFKTIVKIDNVVFLENKSLGIVSYCDELKKLFVDKAKIGSVVMNLNPITNGHLYLIEEASSMCDHLHLFLVKEDQSSFPYEVRLKLLKESVGHITNLTIHVGSEYVISSATFPTYFIKSSDEVDKSYPKLDIAIFTKYIASALNINMRFVGEEPYSKTTNIYNEVLKEELPKCNIEVIVFKRKEINNEIVSASKVRGMIRTGNVSDVRDYVPSAVYNYLNSEEAKEIILKIKNTSNRH